MKKISLVSLVAVLAMSLMAGTAAFGKASAFDYAKAQYKATGDAVWITDSRAQAVEAIEEAEAIEPDGKALDELDKANKELAKGDAELLKEDKKGDPEKPGEHAINKYKKAYEHALKALAMLNITKVEHLLVNGYTTLRSVDEVAAPDGDTRILVIDDETGEVLLGTVSDIALQGPQGEQGLQGLQGPEGEKGEPGPLVEGLVFASSNNVFTGTARFEQGIYFEPFSDLSMGAFTNRP